MFFPEYIPEIPCRLKCNKTESYNTKVLCSCKDINIKTIYMFTSDDEIMEDSICTEPK